MRRTKGIDAGDCICVYGDDYYIEYYYTGSGPYAQNQYTEIGVYATEEECQAALITNCYPTPTPIPFTTPFTNHFVFSNLISPKRNEFNWAIGRAPIVKISRLIPPTPVAAP